MTEPVPQGTSKGQPGTAKAALFGCCPRCHSQTLFAGVAKFADRCRVCGLDFTAFNVGDGPAAFLILIVGAVVVAAALTLELAVEPPAWVHLIWVPVAAALTLGGLRVTKAWLLAQEYKHRAREGRLVE